MKKPNHVLLVEAKTLLEELVESREFILYIGIDGSYHNRIKQWLADLKEGV